MTQPPTDLIALADDETRKLAALEKLLEGEPPYPEGTMVRHLQDERDELRARQSNGDSK